MANPIDPLSSENDAANKDQTFNRSEIIRLSRNMILKLEKRQQKGVVLTSQEKDFLRQLRKQLEEI